MKNITWDKVHVYSSVVEHIAKRDSNYEKFVGGYISEDSLRQKISSRPKIDRAALVEHFKAQYQSFTALNESNLALIESLIDDNTYTLTTGHQLCFLSGPMYLPIKIFQTINLAQKFKAMLPEYNFVPIYWMATEDHDYEEIQSTFLFDKKVSTDAILDQVKVGTISSNVIKSVLGKDVNEILCRNEVGSELYQIIQKIFKKSKTIKEFMFHFCHKFFGGDSFLVLDADSAILKNCAKSIFEKELQHGVIKNSVNDFEEELNEFTSTSISPRNINLFAFEGDHRYRLELENGEIVNADNHVTVDVKALLNKPENISPNVLCRPFYQEAILPNLAYIGGAAELGYWAELTNTFKNFELQQPFVVLRNSVMVAEQSDLNSLEQAHIEIEDLFQAEHLITDKLLALNGTDLNFDPSVEAYTKYMEMLLPMAEQVDFTLKAHLEKHQAQELQYLKKLKKDLKKRALAKEEVQVRQLLKLREKMLPNGKLNERKTNVLQYVIQYGFDFLPRLQAASGAESEGLTVLHTA